MNLLAETRLKGVDWKALGTIDGTAEHVPTALRRLAEAETAEAARAAYWQLDNRVVVQAQLFEAACRWSRCCWRCW